jgi:predicted nucleic acid-binding Zn ribbon protein
MDDSDRATQQEELARAQALEFRRAVPRPTGFCLNCGESLPPGQPFCSAEADGDGCARDWEKARAARLRNGQ